MHVLAADGLLVALGAGAKEERRALEADGDVRALEEVGDDRIDITRLGGPVDAFRLQVGGHQRQQKISKAQRATYLLNRLAALDSTFLGLGLFVRV
jgi:hypothetical protein